MFLQELFTLAVAEAEEDNVHLVKRHLVGKTLIGFANESFMYVAQQIASIAFRVGKDNLYLRMVQQQTNQFSACIACSTQYSNLYHNLCNS